MLTYPHIDPVALQIGPVAVHWYGLMYLAGFAGAWLLGRFRVTRPDSTWTIKEFDDLISLCMLGVIAGGRLGYVFFYEPVQYLANPVAIVQLWKGGMSFHGGLVGVLVCFFFFARKTGRHFWTVADFAAPLVPVGLFAGRIGNFINGELWGRVTSSPFGMVFPGAGPLPRHPSQLYEAVLEGLVLFVLCWLFSAKKRPPGSVCGVFALGYGTFRFCVEFFRQPDPHLGFILFDWLTMGQLLCIPLILTGLALCLKRRTSQS